MPLSPLTDLQVHHVPPDELRLYPGKARRGDIDTIAESLRTNGQYRPILVRRETSEILAGNDTCQAVQLHGWDTILVQYLDGLTDDQARKIVLVDNKSNDAAGYDDQALAQLLADLEGDLTGTGFAAQEVAELLALLEPEPTSDTDVDDIPDPPAYPPLTKVGDLWELGPHRLAVGDSCDPDVIAEACGHQLAELLVTDPPYNIAYEGGTKDRLRIANDSMTTSAFLDFLHRAFTAAIASGEKGGGAYIFYASSEGPTFRSAMELAGWLYKQDLVWIKNRFVLSRQDYHWQHEPILYGWKPGAAHRWYGGFTPTTVIDDQDQEPRKMSKAQLVEIVEQLYATGTTIRADRPTRNDDHPTAKPVTLIARLVENSSRVGDLVLDPFGGSGSTLIAAHTTRRRAATIELDPRYADVICRRWQAHTGVLPVKAGQPVDFVAHHNEWRERAGEVG